MRSASDNTRSASSSSSGPSIRESASNSLHQVEREARREYESVKSTAKGVAEEVSDKAKSARRNLAAANSDAYRPAYYHNIGSEYDVTFAQPPLANRFILTTPNLWRIGSGKGSSSLSLSSIHDVTTDANQSQLTSTLRYCDQFGPASVHTPAVKDTHGNPVRLGFEWNRPIHTDTTLYTAMPMNNTIARPTIKITNELKDIKSGTSIELANRFSGNEFLHTLKARGQYGAMTMAWRNLAKAPQSRFLSSSIASTLYRDAAAHRSVSAGIQVDSSRYNASESFPSSVGSVAFKAEYDEPAWTVDASATASQYSQPSNGEQSTFKLSDARIRAVYAHGRGMFPRWCAGASVGVVDGGNGASQVNQSSEDEPFFQPYNEPEPFMKRVAGGVVGQLTNPVASVGFHYQLNPRNKMKLAIDSNRTVQSSYQYDLMHNVSFIATFRALFPSFDYKSVDSIASAGSSAKTSLGIAVQISAE